MTKQIEEARSCISAATHRLHGIVPPKWEDSVPLCVKVERDEILRLLREALAALPKPSEPDNPAYIRTGMWT